ncbi:hypothetical protein PILCRDRAFT_444010 [Piloderma croceum F 1598]|uniref:Uncharacterized protein n=1 Tax=Piloderma croceum (strain F 1598) TaxID=765440 RepID=A0A0C3C1F6_PILCF|nr:hypothetical protein PILCRDRAFT_444010 [Piloderma croceum F 1598]
MLVSRLLSQPLWVWERTIRYPQTIIKALLYLTLIRSHIQKGYSRPRNFFA